MFRIRLTRQRDWPAVGRDRDRNGERKVSQVQSTLVFQGTQRGREGVTAEAQWGWKRESSPEGSSSQPAVTEL